MMTDNKGHIPYGGMFAIPPSVNLGSLGLSEPSKRLAEAIRDYGMYVVDGGGCNAGALRADQYLNNAIRQQLINDIPKLYPHIRLVTNSAWTPNQQAVGGGSPIAPNCAFDAQ